MFPYISTFDANYGPELTGLLSQMATWQMLQLQPQLEKLLAGSGAVVTEAKNVGVPTGGDTFSNIGGSSTSFAAQSRVCCWGMILTGLLALVLSVA